MKKNNYFNSFFVPSRLVFLENASDKTSSHEKMTEKLIKEKLALQLRNLMNDLNAKDKLASAEGNITIEKQYIEKQLEITIKVNRGNITDYYYFDSKTGNVKRSYGKINTGSNSVNPNLPVLKQAHPLLELYKILNNPKVKNTLENQKNSIQEKMSKMIS